MVASRDDVFVGGGGSDTFVGGPGIDTIDFSAEGGGQVLN